MLIITQNCDNSIKLMFLHENAFLQKVKVSGSYTLKKRKLWKILYLNFKFYVVIRVF